MKVLGINGGARRNGNTAILVSIANNGLLKRKVGVAVSAARRAGAVHTVDSITTCFLSAK